MKIADAEAIGDRVVEWCAKNLGTSKYHDGLPIIDPAYESDAKDTKDIYGEYDQDQNLIQPYTRLNRTVKQLVNTVIHEYTHYLQNPTWLQRYLAKHGHTPNRNPYEARATANGLIYTEKCMKDLQLH